MDSIDLLYSLQKSLQKQIEKRNDSKLVDCLRKEGTELEQDYYNDEWYCGHCGEKFLEGDGLYFNTSGDGIEFCNKCLNTEFSKIFKRPTKYGEYRYCSICENNLPKQKPFAFQCKKTPETNLCDGCVKDPNESKKSFTAAKKIIDKEISKLEVAEQKRIEFLNSAETIAKPYIEAGLGESFALAIGKGVNPDDVLSSWEAEWWKQYPDDDPLLVAVLDGKFTEDEARYINDFRSGHDILAIACIQEKITIQWARALLDCGFNESPKSVEIILKGADPLIISRLHKIDCNKELIPPKLTEPVIMPSNEE
jgi:hypothetical protein